MHKDSMACGHPSMADMVAPLARAGEPCYNGRRKGGGLMDGCMLCPRRCGAFRDDKEGLGFCRMPETMRIARIAPHLW